ncbi:M15 family metallopeptidase [Neisseriaceae bacterium TC5R-5]|nr:M15 family metallopeptidase [Neisseriaceae bacterium TC5R-5]
MNNSITLEQLAVHPEYVAIAHLPGVSVDLRYATADNFIGHDLYGGAVAAYLHRQAASQLVQAVAHLQQVRPGWRLRVFDALRPARVQRVLWDKVKDTEQQIYVANPARGSIHSFGMAVDVSLEDEAGVSVDMGTDFDDFSLRAQPQYEAQMLAEGLLSTTQVAHRELLRQCLFAAGFIGIATEWWHFEAADRQWVRDNMCLVE